MQRADGGGGDFGADEASAPTQAGADDGFPLHGLLRQPKCVNCAAGCDRDILFSIQRKCYGGCVDCAAHLEVPQRLQGGCVEGDEIPFGIATENQSPCGGEHSGPCWGSVLKCSFDLASCGVDGFQESEIGLRVL